MDEDNQKIPEDKAKDCENFSNIDINKIRFLPYEKQMFIDLVQSDALFICAKGIPLDRVIINFLEVYGDSSNLVLVINTTEWEENYYKSKLDKKYVKEIANTANERERIYLEGGIHFISTRVLVVDLLKKRIPIELITGIVVFRAHTIIESCQEAFALRLFRQTNKTGFIKSFSSNPEAFTIGYSHVERIMRNLFVKELFIWPRFHIIIQTSLKPYEPKIIELSVKMTQKMIQIQTYILDIMNYLVKEIKRINRTVDLQEITVENCITKNFHKILQAQLDCIWHQLNSQTKLIVADLKVLRSIMISTIYNDSVSTYNLVRRYRTKDYALSNSGWTLLDSAENLFKITKERVYNKNEEFEPEVCPKWKVLFEILCVEIPNDVKRSNIKTESIKVLILCQNSRTCFQLNHYLVHGSEKYLFCTAIINEIPISKLSDSYKNLNSDEINSENIPKKKMKSKNFSFEKDREGEQSSFNNESEIVNACDLSDLKELLTKDIMSDEGMFKESYVLTMTQTDDNVSIFETSNLLNTTVTENAEFEPFPEMEDLNITQVVATNIQPFVCIQTFKTEKEGIAALERTLNELKPQYIIMYHCNVTAIRQIEAYEARKQHITNERSKIFFLLYGQTVEEQSYLTNLRREKQAFELLIETKSKMVVPEYQDGKTDEAFILMNHPDDLENDENTRKAGGQESKINSSKVIVDMREFRSDLPCLIHRRGLEVIPVTISIGDYIITPEICIERKSISDLIGSLNSGRLYNQCIHMQRFYPKPILLIEFDQNRPFYLQGKYMLSESSITNSDIVQKLQLLTLHFPKLRLIWSPSPYATAQLFEELKQGKNEPDPKAASVIGSDDSEMAETHKFNPNIFDFLIRLPGINSKNINNVMKNGGCLTEILKRSEKELAILLDSEINAKLFWNILHETQKPVKSEIVKSGTFKFKRGRGRKF